MGHFSEATIPAPRPRKHRRVPLLPTPKSSELICGLVLRPNCDHAFKFVLPGDGRELYLDQNQMALMLQAIREAQCEITTDDGRSERLQTSFVPLLKDRL